MKKRISTLFTAFLFIFSVISLTACGDEEQDIVTKVDFVSYDNGDGDMVSFYMTSDTKPYGTWEYTIENKDIFDVFMDSETSNDYGLFGWGGTASYRTLILKPIAEGESTLSFNLTDGDMTYKFSVKVTKDADSGMFKIETKAI